MKLVPRQPELTADVSRGKMDRISAIKTVISVVLVLGIIYVLLGWLGVLLSSFVPDSWEKRLSGTSKALEKKSEDSLERPQRILDRLTKGESLRDLHYRLFWLDFDVPNAVAVPGGGIGVSKALLNEVESDIGLAFVLAHELGHHQNRHILRGLGRGVVLSLAFSMAAGQSGDSLSTAVRAAETGFSRKQERQADDFGMNLVHQKFGHTDGALEFFEDMYRENEESLLQKYLGSHPLTAERLEHLRGLQRSLQVEKSLPN